MSKTDTPTKVWTASEMGRKGGKIGGKARVPKGFAAATPEQRAAWGRAGGRKSKRPPTKQPAAVK